MQCKWAMSWSRGREQASVHKDRPENGGETDGLGEPAFWLPSVDHKDPMKVLEGEQITSVLQRSWTGRDAGVD